LLCDSKTYTHIFHCRYYCHEWLHASLRCSQSWITNVKLFDVWNLGSGIHQSFACCSHRAIESK
jgi:hypothetical protein